MRFPALFVCATALGCGPLHAEPEVAGHAEMGPGALPLQSMAFPGWAPGDRAATTALLQYGKPYCWGGSGPDCFDCSGLTFSAWRSAGFVIPRTSEAQHERLRAIPMDALKPGDVLWRPGHVGLYVGRGWAIHAPGRARTVQYQKAAKYSAAHRPVW